MYYSHLHSVIPCAVSERLRRVAYDKALYISTVTLLYLQRGIDSAHDVAGMPHG